MSVGAPSAGERYSARVEWLNAQLQAQRRRGHFLGVAKLAVAAAALVSAAFLMRAQSLLALAGVLGALFIALAVWHEKLLQKMRCRERSLEFYERGLARLQHRWMGIGETGERFVKAEHPYARDLDIFGEASLFQYLWTGRTRSGEETLARWLQYAAPGEDIAARQLAVRELAPLLEFREDISTAGDAVRSAVDPEGLAAWGERTAMLSSAATRIVTTLLALAWLLSIAIWAWRGSPDWALLMSVLNFAYAHKINARWNRAAEAIENASRDLALLAGVLRVMERQTFRSARLVALREQLQSRGRTASREIRRLARLADLIESRHSIFARPFDLFTFWSAQLIFMAETWQQRHGPVIRAWIAAAGEVEALNCLATLAFEHPQYAFPEFTQGACFEAEAMAHPLLDANAVVNDVALGPERQLMILSGPNMAGKSTFIRSMGVNAVLAQCGAPVRARRLRMSPLQVAASICILDSLSGGVSRFYAEIRRLKLISDLASGPVPVLFLLDELLSGTNSHDRFLGTRGVLEHLTDRGAIGVVSTHDLALARIPYEMRGRAFNAHFDDRVENGALIFDYVLKPGVVQTSNALKLMRAIGLGVDEAG